MHPGEGAALRVTSLEMHPGLGWVRGGVWRRGEGAGLSSRGGGKSGEEEEGPRGLGALLPSPRGPLLRGLWRGGGTGTRPAAKRREEGACGRGPGAQGGLLGCVFMSGRGGHLLSVGNRLFPSCLEGSWREEGVENIKGIRTQFL